MNLKATPAETSESFLAQISEQNPSSIDRALALLWWHTKHASIGRGLSIGQICEEIRIAGYGQQNGSRLKYALTRDRRAIANDNLFKLSIIAIGDLDRQYIPILKNKPVQHSNSIFEMDAFKQAHRGYLDKVILQINRSYDEGLFDCCAVMIRRLLETLIIEIYDAKGRAVELKGADGNFYMFSGLLNYIENDKSLHLGRNTMQGLRRFKKLADSSAHSRHFNASKKDIDDLKQDIQLAATELRMVAFGV